MMERYVRRFLSFALALTLTFSQGITSFAADVTGQTQLLTAADEQEEAVDSLSEDEETAETVVDGSSDETEEAKELSVADEDKAGEEDELPEDPADAEGSKEDAAEDEEAALDENVEASDEDSEDAAPEAEDVDSADESLLGSADLGNTEEYPISDDYRYLTDVTITEINKTSVTFSLTSTVSLDTRNPGISVFYEAEGDNQSFVGSNYILDKGITSLDGYAYKYHVDFDYKYSNGYVYTGTLTGLRPSTNYRYRIAYGYHDGTSYKNSFLTGLLTFATEKGKENTDVTIDISKLQIVSAYGVAYVGGFVVNNPDDEIINSFDVIDESDGKKLSNSSYSREVIGMNITMRGKDVTAHLEAVVPVGDGTTTQTVRSESFSIPALPLSDKLAVTETQGAGTVSVKASLPEVQDFSGTYAVINIYWKKKGDAKDYRCESQYINDGIGIAIATGLESNTEYEYYYSVTNMLDSQKDLELFTELYRSETRSFTTKEEETYKLSEIFPDEKLRGTVKSLLWKYTTSDNISNEALEQVTTLNCRLGENETTAISSLEGIGYLTNLRYLQLTYQNIKSIPEEEFAQLKLLENLDLRWNKLGSMPDLSKCGSLTQLQVSYNHIPESEFSDAKVPAGLKTFIKDPQIDGDITVSSSSVYYQYGDKYPFLVRAKGLRQGHNYTLTAKAGAETTSVVYTPDNNNVTDPKYIVIDNLAGADPNAKSQQVACTLTDRVGEKVWEGTVSTYFTPGIVTCGDMNTKASYETSSSPSITVHADSFSLDNVSDMKVVAPDGTTIEGNNLSLYGAVSYGDSRYTDFNDYGIFTNAFKNYSFGFRFATPAAGDYGVELKYNGVQYRFENCIHVAKGDDPVQPVTESISISTKDITMFKGQERYITATVTPASKENTVKWTTSNSAVVAVEGNGRTAHLTAGNKAGSATITAALGNKKATLKVTVSGDYPIVLDKKEIVLTSKNGAMAALTATLSGEDLSDDSVRWTVSGDSDFLTLSSESGKEISITPEIGLTSKKNATVTAEVEDSEGRKYQASCAVTVTPQATVAAPAASIASGAVKKGTGIQLTSTTYQADIYYTTDGITSPDPEAFEAAALAGTTEDCATKLYGNAIVIREDTTIKAIAVKEGLKDSEVKTFSYTVSNDTWGDIDDSEVKALFHNNSSEVPEGLWFTVGDNDNYYTKGGTIARSETYTGGNITFEEGVAVYYSTEKLQENRDYTVKYANNKLAAAADAAKAPSVTVTGKGNYSNKAVFNFAINKADLKGNADCAVESVLDIAAGTRLSNVKPAVTYMGSKLSFGKEYTAEYFSDSECTSKIDKPAKELVKADTTYYIRLTAKENSNYESGEAFATVTVTGYDSKTTVLAEKLKLVNNDGKPVTVPYDQGPYRNWVTDRMLVADAGGWAPAYMKDGKTTLEYGVDYTAETVEGDDYDSVGLHKVLITCKETTINGKTYKGSHIFTFEITGESLSKNVKVAGLKTAVEYTGRPVTIEDLFAEDTMCKACGWNEVTLYSSKKAGRLTTFQRISNSFYTVSMDNDGTPGKFRLTFTGKAGYTGTITKTITIKAYNLQKDSAKRLKINVAEGSAYTKTGAKPEVTVKFGDTVLQEGVDYTLSYKNNAKVVEDETALNKLKASARPTVTVKGKGNFTGSNATETFLIGKAPVTNAVVTAGDVTYNAKGKKGYFLVKPRLMDDGKALKAGKNKDVDAIANADYSYTYAEDALMLDGSEKGAGSVADPADRPQPGTVIRVAVKVKCSGKSNYTSDAEGTVLTGLYRIIDSGRDISKYTVKVKDPSKLAYAGGDEILPLKGDDLIVSRKVSGKVETLTASDYEIVSIKNNRLVGKATVTIRGKGLYGGTKTFTVKIGARSMN